MPRQVYPGEYNFHKKKIESQQAKQTKQAKQRTDTRRRMTDLRQRRLMEYQHNNDMARLLIAEQAIERYNFDFEDFGLTNRILWLDEHYENVRCVQAM